MVTNELVLCIRNSSVPRLFFVGIGLVGEWWMAEGGTDESRRYRSDLDPAIKNHSARTTYVDDHVNNGWLGGSGKFGVEFGNIAITKVGPDTPNDAEAPNPIKSSRVGSDQPAPAGLRVSLCRAEWIR